jgi:RND superfamily putative drug exporter
MVRLGHGDTLLVTAADPRAGRAFVLTAGERPAQFPQRIGGAVEQGDADVRAHPGRAARQEVSGDAQPARTGGDAAGDGEHELLDGAADPLRELRRALAGGTTLVAIDGLDTLAGLEGSALAPCRRDDREGGAVVAGGCGVGSIAQQRGRLVAVGAGEGHRPSVAALALTTGAAGIQTQVISA